MRKWHKYLLDHTSRQRINLPVDHSFEAHARGMGGYEPDDAYHDKEGFFRRWYYGYHLGRLEYYDSFLRKRIEKEEEVLSVASGRCANELHLLEEGHAITCSDLEIPPCCRETCKLFPEFKFIKLNILEGPAEKTYDAVICLSLIYLFNNDDLSRFFRNVSGSLKKGGHLLLDSAGSTDNKLLFFLDEIVLKYETFLLRGILSVRNGQRHGLMIKHHGYRRSTEDIVDAAWQAGFKLVGQDSFGYLAEFRRSYFVNKVLLRCKTIEKTLNMIGKKIPYIRMFDFVKAG